MVKPLFLLLTVTALAINKNLLLSGSQEWVRFQTKRLRKTLETVAGKIKIPIRQMRQRCLQ